MKNKLLLSSLFTIVYFAAQTQVKIGDNSTTINNASILELESTNKGFVLPRVSLTNVSSASPLDAGLLTGTMVYNTNSTITGGSGVGVYYWDGSKWNLLPNTTTPLSYWSLTGNSGTSTSTNFIGTTDSKSLVFKTGNTERMRLSSSGPLLINTTSVAGSEVLNANGSFKLGSVGTVQKNLVSFSGNINVTVAPQFNLVTILGISVITLPSINYSDVTITLPVTLNSSQATVSVSPSFDLPSGVQIAFARLISTTQLKVRLVNASTGNKTVSGNFYFTIQEF